MSIIKKTDRAVADREAKILNILFVFDVSINNPTSGAERVLFEQSIRLQKRGYSVHVITRKLPEHKSNQEVIKGVTEWRYVVDSPQSFTFIKLS